MNVVWHVYNMNISHKILQKVYVIIEYRKENYQDEIGKMKVSKGKSVIIWLWPWNIEIQESSRLTWPTT